MVVLSFFFVVFFVILSVAFFTIMELKFLGYFHFRLGPDSVGFFGYFQSLSDFLSLFLKSFVYFSSYVWFFFFFSPFLGVFLGFFVWFLYFGYFSFFFYYFMILFFFLITSVSVFFFLFSGWSSGSVFSSYGSYRASVQVVSYEVSMFFILICLMIFFWSYDFFFFFDFMISFSFFFYFFPLFSSWVICCLAESNRPPFDFSEGESELVSGFNVEYSGGFFSIIFMSEYSMMLFFSYVSSLFFFGAFLIYLSFIFFCVFYFWFRGSFPRLRFDKLMIFNWKVILPLVLSYYVCLVGLF